MALSLMIGILIRKRETLRQSDTGKMEAESHKPRNARSHQTMEEARKDSP